MVGPTTLMLNLKIAHKRHTYGGVIIQTDFAAQWAKHYMFL